MFQKNIGAQIALYALVILAFMISAEIQADPLLASGFRLNDGKLHGTFGIVLKVSENIYTMPALDAGGDVGAAGNKFFYRSRLSSWLSLWIIAGGQIEYVELEPDPQILAAYAAAATGAALTARINSSFSVWIAYDQLFTDAEIQRFKIGAGILSNL